MALVVEHGLFVLGPEVAELEALLVAFVGQGHAVTCASGTDALLLALMAWGVGPGSAVFVPSFTFAATAEAVMLLGANPVFVDVDARTCHLQPASLEKAVTEARRLGLRPEGVIPVDLFGQPAEYDIIEAIAAEEGLWVLADAAQSLGARCGDRPVGTLGQATATSFYPTKPLGCYGDGGAVFTGDSSMAAKLRSLRAHGHGESRYDHESVGMTARLDTLQAAVLIQKLAVFPEELATRQRIADRYNAELGAIVEIPVLRRGATSSWACYTIQTDRRDAVAARMAADGVPTAVHYPKPLHQQPAYRRQPCAPGGLPVSEALARRVLSLPLHPYLSERAQDRVISVTAAAVTGAK